VDCIHLSVALRNRQSVAAVPDEWQSATIIVAFKKDEPSSVSNYRPISLTCVLSKIMERVLSHKLHKYLKIYNAKNCLQDCIQMAFAVSFCCG